MATLCHSVRSLFSPDCLSFQFSLVATRMFATVIPEGMARVSGSAPRLPIRITLLIPRAMARGINKVILIGNLGADPETRAMPSGMTVANIRVATSENWKDKQSGENKERTEWHNVAMFGRLGEIAGEYLKKGSKVYIEGSLRTRKWQDKQGQDRYTTEIIANEMQMLDPRGGGMGGGGGGGFGGGGGGGGGSRRGGGGGQSGPPDDYDQGPPSGGGGDKGGGEFDDDIPF